MKSKSQLGASPKVEKVGKAAHDPAKAGFHKLEMGGMEKKNYQIEGGMAKKDESPYRNEKTSVHEIAHHSVTGEMYSGKPESHGHGKK